MFRKDRASKDRDLGRETATLQNGECACGGKNEEAAGRPGAIQERHTANALLQASKYICIDREIPL